MAGTSLVKELYRETCETGKDKILEQRGVISFCTIYRSPTDVTLAFLLPYFYGKRNLERRREFDKIVDSTIREFVREENERLQASHKKLPEYKRPLESEEVASERRDKFSGLIKLEVPWPWVEYVPYIVSEIEVYKVKRFQKLPHTSEKKTPIFYIRFDIAPVGSCRSIEGAELLDKILEKAASRDEKLERALEELEKYRTSRMRR